jgi:hypothetical protein
MLYNPPIFDLITVLVYCFLVWNYRDLLHYFADIRNVPSHGWHP